MISLRNVTLSMALVLCAGCSAFFPYENEFACPRKDHMGKCVSSMEAYREITTGKSSAPYAVPASERGSSAPSHDDQKKRSTVDPDAGYLGYVQSNYEQQRQLLDRPVTPLLKSPEVLEILVTSYMSDDGKQLNGGRVIHKIVQDSTFIMGDYLKKKTMPIESLFGN